MCQQHQNSKYDSMRLLLSPKTIFQDYNLMGKHDLMRMKVYQQLSLQRPDNADAREEKKNDQDPSPSMPTLEEDPSTSASLSTAHAAQYVHIPII